MASNNNGRRKPRLKITREGHAEIIDAQGDPWPIVPGSRNLFYAIVLFLWNGWPHGRTIKFDFRVLLRGFVRSIWSEEEVVGWVVSVVVEWDINNNNNLTYFRITITPTTWWSETCRTSLRTVLVTPIRGRGYENTNEGGQEKNDRH